MNIQKLPLLIFVSMPKFLPVTDETAFWTGDVLRVHSDYHIIDHYAVVFSENGQQYIAEKLPSEEIKKELLIDYRKRRKLTGYLRNANTMAVTDEMVLEMISKCNEKKYNMLRFNCEDFVRQVCKCDVGISQRQKWGLGIAGTIIGSFLGYFIFKNTRIGRWWGAVIGGITVLAGIILTRQIRKNFF